MGKSFYALGCKEDLLTPNILIMTRILDMLSPIAILIKCDLVQITLKMGEQEQLHIHLTFEEIHSIVQDSLEELYEKDFLLLRHDVSERAITHKLAEYLHRRIWWLDVDCEYNRNVKRGEFAQKKLYNLQYERRQIIKKVLKAANPSEDKLQEISTYPDIIVHRRTENNENFLVIEIKKRNSKISPDFDHQKLKAFTDQQDRDGYHYSYGVFILLDTRRKKLKKPTLTWFVAGVEYTGAKIPKFTNEEELAKWVATHDTTPFIDEMEEVQEIFVIKRTQPPTPPEHDSASPTSPISH